MSKLRVNLPPSDGGSLIQYKALLNVYNLTANGSNKKEIRNHVVQDGSELELSPGKYLVEVMLPTGQVLSTETELGNNNIVCEINFSESLEGPESKLINIENVVAGYKTSLSAIKKAQQNDISVGFVSIPHRTSHDYAQIASFDSLILRGYFSEAKGAPSLEASLSTHGAIDRKAEIDLSTLKNINDLIITDDFTQSKMPRHFLLVKENRVPIYISALPFPLLEDNDIDLKVKDIDLADLSSFSGILTNLSKLTDYFQNNLITDPDFSSLLGYLSAGKMPEAWLILKQAGTKFNFENINNPLISAAVEYVIFHFGEEWSNKSNTTKTPLYCTSKKLMDKNIWLPDGAILCAWFKIKYCRSDIELVKSAREDLLEAFRRGAPYYSMGVKMLLNGLTLFANEARQLDDKDEAVEDALKVVLPLALRTSPHNPFTTVSFHFGDKGGP